MARAREPQGEFITLKIFMLLDDAFRWSLKTTLCYICRGRESASSGAGLRVQVSVRSRGQFVKGNLVPDRPRGNSGAEPGRRSKSVGESVGQGLLDLRAWLVHRVGCPYPGSVDGERKKLDAPVSRLEAMLANRWFGMMRGKSPGL